MVEFAGWEMPVQYDGVIAEAQAVRQGAGMFDVSHMARLQFRGPAAFDYLEWVTTNDVSKLADYGSEYSLLPNESGGVVDDIIVYRISPDWFRMVVNAANHQKDLAWFRMQLRDGVEITDETSQTAMIAVQGPNAVEIVDRLANGKAATTERYTARELSIQGVPVFAARTGYTGEDGFELVCPIDAAEGIWDALGAEGVKPCGLAARDVLRVEAGLPLYGHELSDTINPIESGLGWVVSKTKQFIGSGPINAMRAAGPPRKLVGVRMDSKIVPREGYEVQKSGRRVGAVSSGVYSPTLERGIAFAFVETAAAGLNEPCEVIIRDRSQPAMMVNKRFLASA